MEILLEPTSNKLMHAKVSLIQSPPTNLSKLLIILLVFSILSIAWIMAAALSLSPLHQIVCGKYCILIPLIRSSRALRTSLSVPSHTQQGISHEVSNGNGPVSVTTDTNGMIKVLPPKTAKEVVARERERKARTTLLMALPEDHLAKFYKMADAKDMWEAIKSRFSGNDESKKMQKYLLKQQFEGFSVSTLEGLHKGYDSTNDVSTAYSVSSPLVSKSQKEGSSSYTDDVLHSVFVNQSSAPQLDYDDLEQINDDDMEEMDLKWQFDTKDPVGFDKTKVECFNCHKMGHFARDCKAKGNKDSRRSDAGYNGNKARDNGRRPAYPDDSKALVTLDGEDIDWSGHESGLENTSVNDRYAVGMHAVPPPMTGNYMSFEPDVEIDYSKFTYGPKQTSVDESDSKPSEYASCESDSSVETTTSMPAPIENAPKGNVDTAVKASACCNWRNKRNSWNKVFKYNNGSKFRKSVKDPLGRLKSEMDWVSKRN
nr:xylulose kinase-1 [Tanacetum cinerariifolium]